MSTGTGCRGVRTGPRSLRRCFRVRSEFQRRRTSFAPGPTTPPGRCRRTFPAPPPAVFHPPFAAPKSSASQSEIRLSRPAGHSPHDAVRDSSAAEGQPLPDRARGRGRVTRSPPRPPVDTRIGASAVDTQHHIVAEARHFIMDAATLRPDRDTAQTREVFASGRGRNPARSPIPVLARTALRYAG